MVLPHKTKTNKENIRNAIIDRIRKISAFKRRHPTNKHISAKFLYLKEPVGKGPFRIDRIDSTSAYHEGSTYTLSWTVVNDYELMNIYKQLRNGETYCFYLKDEVLSKQSWDKDSKRIDNV